MAKTLIHIGWREHVDLPEFDVIGIEAKIDTGAKSSVIHAFFIRDVEIDGAPIVEFTLHPKRDRHHPELMCRALLIEKRIIRSSNGEEETRPVIATEISLGGVSRTIEVTLTNRESMKYRMLLGRDALRGAYLVDPDVSFILG